MPWPTIAELRDREVPVGAGVHVPPFVIFGSARHGYGPPSGAQWTAGYDWHPAPGRHNTREA